MDLDGPESLFLRPIWALKTVDTSRPENMSTTQHYSTENKIAKVGCGLCYWRLESTYYIKRCSEDYLE